MLIDARTVADGKVLNTDVCIVGAGAAGITLAREFKDRQFKVALIESGGLNFDTDTQSLYQGETAGHNYFPLDTCRTRFFGGTTNSWQGTCRPLDEMDFEVRDWIPFSGWPFKKSHLDPYYQRAQPLLQLGVHSYDAKDWHSEKHPQISLVGDRLYTSIFQFSPPTNFGQFYRDEILKAQNITTYTFANVVDIETTATSREVTRLKVATLSGNNFWIAGRIFVLAMGGIEIPRLLLLSNEVQKTGLGNQNDLVGRFFLEHPILPLGTFALADPNTSLSFYEKRSVNGVVHEGFWAPTPHAQRQLNMLNFGVRPIVTGWRKVSKGVASYRILKKGYHNSEIPDGFLDHLGNVISDLDDINKNRINNKVLALRYWQECSPNPDSRITLLNERDKLGMNRVQLDWRLNEMDKKSMLLATRLVGEELGRTGVGRLNVKYGEDDLWLEFMTGSYHHMGTTRMSKDPKKGVVDENTRVHGLENLFITSSSVFPTTGHANPTLTIVALAVRLADHIKGRLT